MHPKIIKSVNAIIAKALKGRVSPLANLYPWQIGETAFGRGKSAERGPDPHDAKLIDLQARYKKFDHRVTTAAVWSDDVVTSTDISAFRGDTQYVWQRAYLNFNEIACALSYYALKAGRAADLLERLHEDGAFGALTLDLDDRLVSRDLIDSVSEIDFLRRHVELGQKHCSILDIGAGYGRLAHRITEAMGSAADVFVTDAFPASTFLSEYYLAYRESPARVIPLDEIELGLASLSVDVAISIHSFSECTVDAINWWVSLISKSNVRYLMVIPNGTGESGQLCLTQKGEKMIPIFESHGYRLKCSEPRYSDPFLQRFGMDPCTLFLFENAS